MKQANNLAIDLPENPFWECPRGIDIARWWADHDRDDDGKQLPAPMNRFTYAQGCEGIDLWRSQDKQDYCYLWVEAFVDHDFDVFFLLDIRTSIGPESLCETRDHLFVAVGAGNGVECEWENKPIEFAAPVEQHRDRFWESMKWFTSRMETWKDAHYGAQVKQES